MAVAAEQVAATALENRKTCRSQVPWRKEVQTTCQMIPGMLLRHVVHSQQSDEDEEEESADELHERSDMRNRELPSLSSSTTSAMGVST